MKQRTSLVKVQHQPNEQLKASELRMVGAGRFPSGVMDMPPPNPPDGPPSI
jgi:hypothetical protein